ncbi:MAG: type II toxin-antitoxin system ParD family antitoxin [Silvibacterium sp.]
MPSREMKTISLPAAEVDRIEALVESGAYPSSAEVVREALIALDEHNTSIEAWLREEILPVAEAYDADPGRGIPAEEVFARLRARYEETVSPQKSKSA